MMPFSDIPISQGSVSTCLKRGGIFFEHEFVANLQPSMLVKNFENRIIVGEVMAKSLVARFLTHGVYTLLAPTALVPSLYLALRARPWLLFHN